MTVVENIKKNIPDFLIKRVRVVENLKSILLSLESKQLTFLILEAVVKSNHRLEIMI